MLCVSYCSTMRNINRNLERLYCITDFFPSAERFKKTAIHSLQIQGPALMINFKGAKSLLFSVSLFLVATTQSYFQLYFKCAFQVNYLSRRR